MSSILFEIKEQVAFITFNRPDKLNSFNGDMALLFQEKLEICKSEAIRCVCITGTGKAFSAGQDLAAVTDAEDPDFSKILLTYYNPIVTAIRSLEKPVVAAVNGVAAGAGANIALCCDIVIAAASASFIQAFSKIGLVPDSGGTFFLPRLVGWQKASALMLLGDKVSATDAEKMGMVYKVYADLDFGRESFDMAVGLARMPTRGLAFTKQILNSSLSNDLAQQLMVENLFQQKAARTRDYKEGVDAFLQKRRPDFTGG